MLCYLMYCIVLRYVALRWVVLCCVICCACACVVLHCVCVRVLCCAVLWFRSQAYADRIAGVFTPFVLLLALLTFTTWSVCAWLHIVPREWFAEEYGSPLLFSMLFGISVVVIR